MRGKFTINYNGQQLGVLLTMPLFEILEKEGIENKTDTNIDTIKSIVNILYAGIKNYSNWYKQDEEITLADIHLWWIQPENKKQVEKVIDEWTFVCGVTRDKEEKEVKKKSRSIWRRWKIF